ncbi:MAG: hypothetical protein U0T74_00685 [Chitinophagales bacterium]
MEFKVIVYIIIGVIYFIHSLSKKKEEKKNAAPAPGEYTPKPVSPPSPLTDFKREIKKIQEEMEAKKREILEQPKPLQVSPPKPQKEMLIHQKKKGLFEEGNYERDLTDEEKIERGKLKIENEGIYKIKSAEEIEEEELNTSVDLDIKKAVIGSVILERRF